MTDPQSSTQPTSSTPGTPTDGFHLARMIASSAERFANRPATRVELPDGSWQVRSYAEFHEQIQRAACALLVAGVQAGDRVVVFSGNRPEWSVVDFATLAVGGIVVPVFATSTAEQVRHVLDDSTPVLAFVAGPKEAGVAAEAVELAAVAPRLVSFDEVPGLSSLDELVAPDECGPTSPLRAEVARRTAAGSPDDVATIVYTSGTTGVSKGVMLTHGGFGDQQDAIDDCWNFAPTESSVCFLPLSHALERDWTFHVFHRGCLNTYCTNPKKIGELLAKARPTMLVSVPMLFEKVMSGVREQASSPVQQRVLRWALRVGGQCQRAYRKGKEPALYWRAQLPWADRLVLCRIRSAVGGSKSLMVSGGAPLRREVEEFFSAAGLLLGQGYGLTESGPMMTIYRTDHYKFGTVGFPIKGAEIAVGDGGELLLRSRSIMKGYWNDPEATAAVLDADGWLHTGDVGHVDLDGFVVVTDRLKDLIVTANGKNVAPQAVEAALMADPTFEQAMVIGDNRPCLVAVVQPSRQGWGRLAEQAGLAIGELRPDQLVDDQRVVEVVRRRAAELTAHLPSHEQVRGVVLADDAITMAGGLVTATMKLRRREIEKAFGVRIERLYDELRRARAR